MTPAEELTLAAERLEALDAAATPGPWDIETVANPLPGVGMEEADAAFIAAMRGVAKPLAAWLRVTLESILPNQTVLDEHEEAALALAREVIRATGGTGDER